MDDYATLHCALEDRELQGQLASARFAVLSGNVFHFREMEQGDVKV
jgi:hypothetical protein